MSEQTPGPPGDDDGGFKIVRFGDLYDPVSGSQPHAPRANLLAHEPEIAGGANGLERTRMLDAIDRLYTTALAIESLEVVRAVCERPQYSIERRSYERDLGEPAAQWCRRSRHQARDFVATFTDPGDGSVRFIIVTTDAEDLHKAA